MAGPASVRSAWWTPSLACRTASSTSTTGRCPRCVLTPTRCTIATRPVASLHRGCQHTHPSPCLPALRLTPRDLSVAPLPVCPPVQLVELVEDTQNVLDDVWRLEVAGGEPYPQGRMQRLLTVISGALGRRVQVRGCGGRWCWC